MNSDADTISKSTERGNMLRILHEIINKRIIDFWANTGLRLRTGDD